MAAAKKPAPVHWTQRAPLLEWISAAIGLVLSIAAIGFVAWDGLQADGRAPQITVQATAIRPAPGGFLVEVEARNLSRETAAAVEIEGALADGETARIQFDYVPGQGRRTGGLLFRTDPRSAGLELNVRGYSIP